MPGMLEKLNHSSRSHWLEKLTPANFILFPASTFYSLLAWSAVLGDGSPSHTPSILTTATKIPY